MLEVSGTGRGDLLFFAVDRARKHASSLGFEGRASHADCRGFFEKILKGKE